MATIRPFYCVRPRQDMAQLVAALPYDVYNREEAVEVVKDAPKSFLNIDRPETQFPIETDMYGQQIYEKARQLLDEWILDGTFMKEDTRCYYLYELTMNGRSQTGVVACVSIDDYENEVIKKHENTRREKEEDRIRHVDVCSAQTGPIFLASKDNQELNEKVTQWKEQEALYDFIAEDGIRHRVFRIDGEEEISYLTNHFAKIPALYIADGHHRTASAVRVGQMRRKLHKNYTGEEEFNYFLSVIFPENELKIFDYNRVVCDLNGKTKEEFLDEVSKCVTVEEKLERVKPVKKGQFGMYLDGKWYQLTYPQEHIPNDVVEKLDVSLLQNGILEPILGIIDPKTDDRIQFVGGIRGLEELERLVDQGQAVAFSMYPTTMEELFAVADNQRLMPPKSTWFEPKLRSGLFIHQIEEV